MDPLLTADAITYRVSNIDADARAADLHDHLSRYGELISLRIVYDPKTSRSKGLAYATFSQYPRELCDETDADRYRDSHLFMQRMLKITQTTAYDVPHDQIPSANESFQVDQMTLGSFVADQTFYGATTMERQVEMVLEFSSFDRKIIWLWKGSYPCVVRILHFTRELLVLPFFHRIHFFPSLRFATHLPRILVPAIHYSSTVNRHGSM